MTIGLSFFSDSIQNIQECDLGGKIFTIVLTSGGKIHVSENQGFDWHQLDIHEEIHFK